MPILTDDKLNEYREFLQKSKKGHFLQSPEWAKVKTDWINKVVVVYDENQKIKGSMSLLIRSVNIGPIKNIASIMYSPRGPVCDIYDKETFKALLDEAKSVAKKYHSFIISIDPDVPSDDEEFKKIVKELGFTIHDDAKDFSQMIQPRYVFRLNVKDKTEEELMASFHEKWRYNIRLAVRKGVEIIEGGRDDLKAFHDLMLTTGVRDNFTIRPLSYFQRMYDELASKGYMKLLLAKYNGNIIAGVIPIIYGNKVWYLYGASSNEYRNVMPNYLLQWTQIKLALENKCDIYDFRGVSGHVDETHPQYGIYKFKKGFNGDFVEFIGEISIVLNPFMNFIYNNIFKSFRAHQIKKMKKKEDEAFEKMNKEKNSEKSEEKNTNE